MRIFITGIAGFLGSHLADKFLEEGHEVFGCDNFIGGSEANVPRGAALHIGDCNELAANADFLEGTDVIYHCAATAYEGLSVFSPHTITQNIVGASVSTFSAAIQARVRRVVFCSSMARYGANPVPFTEDMPVAPQDPYGIGKVAAEAYLRNLASVHGMEYVIAVPHNIYGPRQKYDDPYRNVASIMANRMLQGKQPIIYGDGEQMRCFSYYADDLPVLHRMATDPSVNREIINVGPDEEFVTINDLARELADIIGLSLDPIYVPGRPQEVEYATCSADKARKMLGYTTEWSLRAGLEHLVADIERRGPREFKYHLPVEIQSDLTPKTWTERLI